MLAKKWLKKWFILALSLLLCSFIYIFYLHHFKNVPLRFTNSISFDAKLAFLKNTSKLKNVEILIIGSSMGLNNINSEFLAKGINNNKILNLSSWGLKVDEIFDLLKLVDLSKVKKVVYLNQYFDFYSTSVGSYNTEEIKKFLIEDFSLTAYLNTFYSLTKNFKNYLYWEKRYLDKSKYSNLNFNEYGDVSLYINEKNTSSTRWEAITDVSLMHNHYGSLEEMILFLQEKKITLHIVTTPYRKKFFNVDKFLNQYNIYLDNIFSLKKKYNFQYINLQDILNLDDEYFADSSHLNFEGSKLIALELAKNILKDK